VDLLSGTIARAESVEIKENEDERLRDAKRKLLNLLTCRVSHFVHKEKDDDDDAHISNPLDMISTDRKGSHMSPQKMSMFLCKEEKQNDDDNNVENKNTADDLVSEAMLVSSHDSKEIEEIKILSRIGRAGRREEKSFSARISASSSSSTAMKLPPGLPPSFSKSLPKTKTAKPKTRKTTPRKRSIFKERKDTIIFQEKSKVRNVTLDENTMKEYAITARRCLHLLWHVFTYYTLKTSPDDPYHMTTNGALQFVQDCCCSTERRNMACGGCVTKATSRTFVTVLRKGLLNAGSTGRLMFGDFMRLVSCISAPCRDSVCMYCSVRERLKRSNITLSLHIYTFLSLTHTHTQQQQQPGTRYDGKLF